MLTLTAPLLALALAGDVAQDELALVRATTDSSGKLNLSVHRPPGSQPNQLGIPLASDATFFSTAGAQPVRFVFSADADGDGVDEVCVLRHKAKGDKKRLRVKTFAPPSVSDGSVGKAVGTSKAGTLPSFSSNGAVGGVFTAGAGDSDGDGVDELWLVVTNEDGSQSLEVRALPTTKNEPLDVVLRSVVGIDDQPDTSIVSVCGLQWDGFGREEIAVLRKGAVGTTIAIYQAPFSVGAAAVRLAESAAVPGPTGSSPVALCRVNFDGEPADEIGLLLTNVLGEARFYVYEPPLGFGAFLSPGVFLDSTFDSSNDSTNTLFLMSLRGYSFGATPADLSGTWSATYSHTVSGVAETIEVDHGIVAQQAGGVIQLSFPLFNFAQTIYTQTGKSLEFTTSPVQLNAPNTGILYTLIYSPGIVFAGSAGTFVLGSYTGTKKLPLGQTAELVGGVYLFLAHAP